MTRLFTEIAARKANEVFNLSQDDAAHLNVLRHRPGDRIIVCDGFGNDYVCEITEITKKSVSARIISIEPNRAEPLTKITLYQSLLKLDKMETVIQKCVELGVNKIIPVETEFSVARLENPAHKRDRWQKISKAAAKQCGRGIIPEISLPVKLAEALSDLPERLNIAAYEKETERSLFGLIKNNGDANSEIGLFVGPEGGFSASEINLMGEKDVKTVTLGKRILRAETAGMFTIGLINYLKEEL